MTFKELSASIGKAGGQPFGKDFAELFGHYLEHWAEVPAGKKRLRE